MTDDEVQAAAAEAARAGAAIELRTDETPETAHSTRTVADAVADEKLGEPSTTDSDSQ